MKKDKIHFLKVMNVMDCKMPRYIRKGTCVQCGSCCQNENCEYLKFDGKLWQCLIHDDRNRSDKCKLYPHLPPIIFQTCGYYFYDILEKKNLEYREV